MKIVKLELPACQVGEGPVWDVGEQALYYIDILDQAVFRWEPATGDHRRWDMPDMIGSMALCGDGEKASGAIVALVNGVHRLDFETGAVTPYALLKPENPQIQLADGKVDRAGRFIFGTSHRKAQKPFGGLFSLSAKGKITQLDDGGILGNGPCFSPDNTVLYHADSMSHMIYAYDYDLETGAATNRREFFESSEYGPIPDGATIDADGNMWVAICDGGVVLCLNPSGDVKRVIDMPVNSPASCMFGGPDLNRLFVPSINPSFLGREPAPDDGAMFMIEGLGVRGLPEPRFAG